MSKHERITVLGAGGWGTTLSLILADNGYTVRLWTVEESVKNDIETRRENTVYLPGVTIPGGVRVTTDLNQSLDGSTMVVVAVPSKYLDGILNQIPKPFSPDVCLLSVVKGISPETFETMSEVISGKLGLQDNHPLAVLSGPNLAYEVSRKIPSTTVVASKNIETAQRFLQVFMASHFRVYVTDDVRGVELGGALKNVIALGAGISDGLGYGANAKAALISRGLVEMVRLGRFLGARTETFFGLSGLGDMVATCTSQHSRNRTLGERLTGGEKLDDILTSTKTVAEGVGTTRAVHNLSLNRSLAMPITETVYRVLFKGRSCIDGVKDLMERNPKEEWEI